MSLTGGCLCGQLRYEVDGDPLATAICHCRNCQKQSGSAFSIVALVPAAAAHFHGEMKRYADRGDDSGKEVSRGFCPECGSAIMTEATAFAGMIAIKAGTLDNAASFTPGMQIWCDNQMPWTATTAELPRFPRNPQL